MVILSVGILHRLSDPTFTILVLQFTDQSFVVGWVFSNPEDEHSGVGYQRFELGE